LIKVFIATSLDGYIADLKGTVGFLYDYPDIEGEDMGYRAFTSSIDALVMGRKTFETVLGFEIAWPYTLPVFVWTSQLSEMPMALEGKVHVISGDAVSLVRQLKQLGFNSLYIDGGKTIQSFLHEDLVDEMTLTTIPIILGAGIPLFSSLNHPLHFKCIGSQHYANGVTQSTYQRQHR
jgi:dihydrofolate reductase